MRARVLGIVVLAVGCAGDRELPQEREIVGEYTATMAAPAGAARELTLTLAPGNAADLASVSPAGAAMLESGTWTAQPGRRVRVVLARGGLGAPTTDVTFRLQGARLTAAIEDSLRWGATQLVFERRTEGR